MSYKLGFVLSMPFVIIFFAFGIDLILIQSIYSELDSISVSISYRISQGATMDDTFKQNIYSEYNATFECIENSNPRFGDQVTYTLSKDANTLFINRNDLKLTIKRYAIVGYYA